MLSSVDEAGSEERKREVWNKFFGKSVALTIVHGYVR